MESSKFAVKYFVKDAAAVDPQAFIPLFHQWIQTHALEDHLLIDVADYHHVPSGPGTMLVAHEANLSTDTSNERLGLLYARKQPIDGSLTDRLRVTFRSALRAMQLIETAPSLAGRIQFRTDNPIFRINDRLFAPNTPETFAAMRPALDAFLTSLYGAPIKLSHEPNVDTVFELQITAPASPRVDELLTRL
jgi:hypothetical protein